jgi:hypothetical protein
LELGPGGSSNRQCSLISGSKRRNEAEYAGSPVYIAAQKLLSPFQYSTINPLSSYSTTTDLQSILKHPIFKPFSIPESHITKMAALIIGASVVLADRIHEKRKAKKAARLANDESFQELKAANAARMRQLSQSSSGTQNGIPNELPPDYDAVTRPPPQYQSNQMTTTHREGLFQEHIGDEGEADGRSSPDEPNSIVDRSQLASR